MKLTKEELTTFKNLSNTEVGTFLISYFKRLQDYTFDSRNWGDKGSRENAQVVSDIIQTCLIDKLIPHTLDDKKPKDEESEYE